MTTAIERSPVIARKQQAQAALQRLRTEREQLVTRERTAQQEAQRLNDQITRAARSGEADTLATLRSDRRAAEESVQDLARALPGLDRDIQLAEGALHAATVACHAETWNATQVEQAQLLKTIEDALRTISESLDEKERLAARQQPLLTTVCPGHNHNAALIRPSMIHALTAKLQGDRGLSLQKIDWSSWPMTPGGDLLR